MKLGKKLAAVVGLGMAMLAAAGPAQSIQVWAFQDNDLDFLYRPGEGPGTGLITPDSCVGDECLIGIGDVLISVFEFDSFAINGVSAVPAGKQATGIAAIQYFGDADIPGLGMQRIFVPYSAGLNSIIALGDGSDPTVPGGGAGEGAMAAIFINNATSNSGEDRNLNLDTATAPLTNCSSLADCIDEATKGTLLQVDGMLGDPDEIWLGGNPAQGANINAVWNSNASGPVASVAFALSTIFNTASDVRWQNILNGVYNPLCVGYVADGCVQFLGNATVNGGTAQGMPLLNGAFAHSTTITAQKYIPEPGTLALLGAALLVLVGFQRRKA